MGSLSWLLSLAIVAGVLAPAAPGALERVEARRIRNGWGLAEPAPTGTARLAVEDCRLLGRRGVMAVGGIGLVPVAVVDCQSAADRAARPLSGLGLAADVDVSALGHRRALIFLWRQPPPWREK